MTTSSIPRNSYQKSDTAMPDTTNVETSKASEELTLSNGSESMSTSANFDVKAFLYKWAPWIVFVLAIIGWELLARAEISTIFVTFSELYASFKTLAVSGDLMKHTIASGRTFFIGYALSVIFGILLGIILGTSEVLRRTFEPWIYAFYSIPIVALAPVFIIAFGIGAVSHVIVVFALTFFVITVNTIAGITSADAQHLEVGRAYHASRIAVIKYVLLPASVPFIIAGMRLGVTRALIGVVIAEFFGARAGLGFMVFQAQQRFDTPTVYIGAAILAIVSIVMSNLLGALERRMDTWRT